MCRSYEMLHVCVKCSRQFCRGLFNFHLKTPTPQGEGQTLEANSCTRSAKINVSANT